MRAGPAGSPISIGDALGGGQKGQGPSTKVGQAVHEVTPERFEQLVAEALDAVPESLLALLDNVVVLVEDWPPSGEATLLGRYEGVPLTERGTRYSGVLPDRISIYRLPILAMCRTDGEVVREVNITVVHEIAHHFGIDDDRLHELGYG
jgi:predicted Zn-dependent protease with MMP-like domain